MACNNPPHQYKEPDANPEAVPLLEEVLASPGMSYHHARDPLHASCLAPECVMLLPIAG